MHGWATSRGVEILRKIQPLENVLDSFRPRLPATSFRRAIRIEDVMLLAELAVPLILGAVQR